MQLIIQNLHVLFNEHMGLKFTRLGIDWTTYARPIVPAPPLNFAFTLGIDCDHFMDTVCADILISFFQLNMLGIKK